MGIFNRKMQLSSPAQDNSNQQPNQDTGNQQPAPSANTVEFTAEEYSALLYALALDPQSTPADVVAAVAELVELSERVGDVVQKQEKDSEKIEASLSRSSNGVHIDMNAWQDMQTAIERGVAVEQQSRRLEAEQIVDQAIRLGKAAPGQRETWIKAYHQDKDDTIKRLSRAADIPRFEIGHGLDEDALGTQANWVR